jgi:segregation and condensation protein A
MTDYRVQLEVFEGPLDLLLYLIRKEEVDIYEVNLTKIATQFIEYVERMRRLDLEVAGEFLVMAATLMYIKSRELLPIDQQTHVEGDEETLDPRWELIRQLVEYKKFKDMAARLHAMESEQELTYRRSPSPIVFASEEKTESRSAVTLLDLMNAVHLVLERFDRQEGVREILEERWTVSEKITSVLQWITERRQLQFSELFTAASSRLEVVVTFLALLELTRLKRVQIIQAEPFQDMQISLAPPPEPGAAAVAEPGAGAAPSNADPHGT